MEFRAVPVGSVEYEQAVDLRRRVLRLPLGLDFTPEDLAEDASQLHLVGLAEGRVVAVAVLQPVEKLAKMRQVAVEPGLQGRGAGTQLVAAFEQLSKEHGYRAIVLHAREPVVPFYERLGYTIEGDPFDEVTIPHRKMRKELC